MLVCGVALSSAVSVRAQSTPEPGVTPTPFAQPVLSPSPSESPGASAPPSGSPSPTPTPTLPPISVSPAAAFIPVGATQALTVQGSLGDLTAVPASTAFFTFTINQEQRQVLITGTAPGSTTITITDSRGVSTAVGVRVAFPAGALPQPLTMNITGDPASSDYLKQLVVNQILRYTQVRPGAQAIVTPDDVSVGDLSQDLVANLNVPVLIQGEQYLDVNGSVPVTLNNIAVPRISPDQLMVSDFPEKLTENGILFTTDLKHEAPSRFLYFHYNPPGQPDRRIVLVAQNQSSEPATVQFISGRGNSRFEMEAGHNATRDFLVDVVQNQGRLLQIPGNATQVIAQQDMPAGAIDTNLLQLRVHEGSTVH